MKIRNGKMAVLAIALIGIGQCYASPVSKCVYRTRIVYTNHQCGPEVVDQKEIKTPKPLEIAHTAYVSPITLRIPPVSYPNVVNNRYTTVIQPYRSDYQVDEVLCWPSGAEIQHWSPGKLSGLNIYSNPYLSVTRCRSMRVR